MKNTTKSLFALTLASVGAVASAQGIQVTVDNNPVNFGTQKPFAENGRVLVPLRGVFEQMGAYVQWNAQTREIFASRGSTDIRMTIGKNTAMVGNQTVSLDAPAKIVNGSTVVPLRFLSEALGAEVRWNRESRLVAIMTNGSPGDSNYGGGSASQPIRERTIVDAYTVIPVVLNNGLSSKNSQKGDRFSASVDVKGGQYYGGIPAGAIVEGTVREARAQNGDNPGVLDLNFERLRLPDGRAVPLQASLYSLEDSAVDRNEDGVLIAKKKGKDNRLVYAGYGAGAGLVVGLLSGGKIKLENVLLGGALGALIGSLEKPKQKPSNVELKNGTTLGVRLDEDLAIVQR